MLINKFTRTQRLIQKHSYIFNSFYLNIVFVYIRVTATFNMTWFNSQWSFHLFCPNLFSILIYGKAYLKANSRSGNPHRHHIHLWLWHWIIQTRYKVIHNYMRLQSQNRTRVVLPVQWSSEVVTVLLFTILT